MSRRPDWERRQRVVVDGRTVAEIRTQCPREMPAGRCLACSGSGKLGAYPCPDCFGSGVQDVRRVPSGRDHQPVRCGGTEET